MTSPQNSRGWVTSTQHKQRSSALVREDNRHLSDRDHALSKRADGGERSTAPKTEKAENAAVALES